MLVATQLPRNFIFKKGQLTIELTDPDPTWTIDAVMNFYSNQYPELTTAKASAPAIDNDKINYTFETVIGNKG